jgi:hypothetical protein
MVAASSGGPGRDPLDDAAAGSTAIRVLAALAFIPTAMPAKSGAAMNVEAMEAKHGRGMELCSLR